MMVRPMFGDFIGPARKWFAWRPVTLFDGSFAWLRRIERRRVQKHDYISGGEPLAQWWLYGHQGELQ